VRAADGWLMLFVNLALLLAEASPVINTRTLYP
jgi:hypothetical protein